jgi:holo-[acyl-carrier protein] synthase
MIIGIGTDITSTDRFHSNGVAKHKLAAKILTSVEYNAYIGLPNTLQILYLAKSWAIKEATSKAYGTGIRKSMYWTDIQITKDELGKPIMQLLNRPEIKTHVSTSEEGKQIVAMVVLEE